MRKAWGPGAWSGPPTTWCTSTLRSLVAVSAEELAELNAAATALDRTGVDERATLLRELADKLRALLEQDALTHIEPDLQALMVAEGLAMRPGPRPRLDPGLLGLLRDAIKTGRAIAFDYRARPTGNVNRSTWSGSISAWYSARWLPCA